MMSDMDLMTRPLGLFDRDRGQARAWEEPSRGGGLPPVPWGFLHTLVPVSPPHTRLPKVQDPVTCVGTGPR